MKRVLTLLALLFSPVGVLAAAPFPLDDAVPGGVAVVELPESAATPQVEYSGQRMMVVRHAGHWYALVGLSLDTVPGEKALDILVAGDATLHVAFSVMPKSYPEQALTIADPQMVNPSPEQLARIDKEQQRMAKVMGQWRKTPRPGISFVWPVKGPETSAFGLRRVLNGEPRSPHSGIDIGAPAGTPALAPADAVVADIGNYYYCGKTLTLDMGQGLFSVYCHLSRIKVNVGQKVKRGQLVGKVGATGRTTGPNLHWTVRLNEVPVDPHVFLGKNSPTPPPVTPPPPATMLPPAQATAPAATSSAAPPMATRAAPAAATGSVTPL
ncbi:MAG TPA: peptidoglycan DD-metalloendopeptidase family protein [Gammaproteobacteria bacterium]